jgi:serine/threonine protein kinase/curved DNA-binding protein CbpA
MAKGPANAGADLDKHPDGATEADEQTDRQEHTRSWLDPTNPSASFSESRDHPPPPPRPATPPERAAEDDPWIGQLVANRYRIERQIASGGMGRVYLATQLPLGRKVAVKMVRTEVSGSRQQFLRRFFLEASASAKLTHPNIIIVHDYGDTESGDVFMAMEFLDGRSLDKEIKDASPMPEERALHICIQIGRALREAHSKGIIHRDLKPQNVMLVSQGDEHDFVKVLDFGLVKILSDEAPEVELTRAGVLLGSPNYMSPEQILGGTIDARTDIYSLGVVLYKMLSGKNPYVRDPETDVIYKHVYHPIPTLAEAGAACTPEVEALVRKCLAKSQADRYESCKELITALKEARKAVIGGAKKRKRPKQEDEGPPLELDLPQEPMVLDSGAAVVPNAPLSAEMTPSVSAVSPMSEAWRAADRRSVSPLAQVYLRSHTGEPIGPVPLREIEVLYWARIVDESTPISSDGVRFAAVSENRALLDRLTSIKQRVVGGENPWLKKTPSAPPPDAMQTPVGAMVESAVRELSGDLVFPRAEGMVRLTYSSGRLIEVETDLAGLRFTDFLVEKGLVTKAQLDERIPSVPKDIGALSGMLVASGLIPPHTVLERIVEWVRQVLSTVVLWERGSANLAPRPVDPPKIPLGLDRFAVISEALRGVKAEHIDRAFAEKQTCLVIPAAVDGASVDDFKLAPKELRAIKSVDGTKILRDLLSQPTKEQRESTAKALYLGIEIGLVVFGEDQTRPKERAEAQRLQQLHARLKEKSAFEVLNVLDGAGNEEVRARFMDLAKLYHPDSVRQNAAPELVDALRQMFVLAQESYDAIDTEEKREKYRQIRQLGYDHKESEEDIVRKVLEAEVLFKKAKTLVKLSKYDEAIAAMKDAVARKPRDIELKIHLRYFEFLPNKSDRVGEAGRAIADIAKMMKGDENEIASAFLILGRLYKVVSRDDLATKAFKKVLKFDPKNHEAESELRLANMREQKKKGRRSWLGDEE